MKIKGLCLILVFLVSGVFSGCSFKFRDSLKEANQAIEEARSAGADKKCPEEFQKTVSTRDSATRTYVGCNTPEGIKLAQQARDMAKGLCPQAKPAAITAPPPPPPPVGDSDGDGIKDDVDRCPFEAEDKDGFQDEDGCPDVDNDMDGFLDVNDKCPNEPETQNGFQDEDGCPDKLPVRISLVGVNFANDSAKIEGAAVEILNNAADIFVQNPNLTARIEGHTDSKASAAYNQKLSERRAKAVMDYLTTHFSINPNRLTSQGFGESSPIASNDTTEGRAKNRRIEFVITGGN